MVVVFCTGLIIGTVAGAFSWLAAAAFIESKRQVEEGLFVGVAAQPALTKVDLTPPEERAGRLFRARGRRVAPTVPPIMPETRRPPRSL